MYNFNNNKRIKNVYDNSIFLRCSKHNENNFQWTGVQLFSHYYLSSWEVMFASKNNKCIYVKYLHDESNKKIIINEQYFFTNITWPIIVYTESNKISYRKFYIDYVPRLRHTILLKERPMKTHVSAPHYTALTATQLTYCLT